jgi:hypothetical protein
MPGLLRPGAGLARPPRLVPSPGRNRVYVLPLLLLLLLGAYLVHLGTRPPQPAAPAPPQPSTLDRWAAAGPRGPSCLRLVIGQDVSGSMRDFDAARDQALDQLVRWTGENLRENDELAIVDFAAEAKVRLPPTRIDASPGTGTPTGAADGVDTLLNPVLDMIRAFPPTACDTALVLLSDAQLTDVPPTATDGNAALTGARVRDLKLLAPGREIEVPPQWQFAFPIAAPVFFDGLDPDATALAIGRTIVGLTGQKLAARPAPAARPS